MAVASTFDFDQMLSNAREAFGEELMKMADDGLDFVFTYTDNVAMSSSAGKFIQKYPDRCFNFGIAEPDQVGASCGLALAGNVVYAQVFGPFLPLRAADQIHTDIAYNDVNVRLIGTHSGVTAGGGPTHNDIADLALYRAIPNLTVFVPADAGQCIKGLRAAYYYQGPMIIRINRGGSPNVYANDDYEFEFGKAIETLPGDDCAIISCGSEVYEALMAARILKEKGINCRVIDMHTIKPLDYDMLAKVTAEVPAIIAAEEASINGGLGSAVAEYIAENGYKGKFARIAIPDEFALLGELSAVYHHYGIDAEGIANKMLELLK